MRKKIISFIVTTVVTLVIIESLLRLILAVRIGPDLLFYGTRFSQTRIDQDWNTGVSRDEFFEVMHNVAAHDNRIRDYSKYFPGQKRSDTDRNGLMFDVRINSTGFRGDDFEQEKPERTLRIVCLGDSATFGYGSRDNETYPVILENMLNHSSSKIAGGQFDQVEVLNFGVPHLRTKNIYSLLIHEVIPIKPDIVTVYSGMVDVSQEVYPFLVEQKEKLKTDMNTWAYWTLIQDFSRERLHEVFLTAKLFKSIFNFSGQALVSTLDAEESLNLDTDFQFLHYLSKIREVCLKNDIKLYVILQQAQSEILSENQMKGVTFIEELELVKTKFKNKRVTVNELYFLHYAQLLENLNQWTVKEDVAVIDGVEALNEERNYIWHWMHLQPQGNRILAEEIAHTIIETYTK